MMIMKEQFVRLVNNNDYSDKRVCEILVMMRYMFNLSKEREMLFCGAQEFTSKFGINKMDWYEDQGESMVDQIKKFEAMFDDLVKYNDRNIGWLKFWFESYGGEKMLDRVYGY